MELTFRDIEILCFINDFGLCETRQLCERFSLLPYRINRIMNRLIGKGLAFREKIFFGRDHCFRATEAGASYTNLPKLNDIYLGTYFHLIGSIDLYNKLHKLYPQAHYISERRIRHAKNAERFGFRGHVSDGILLIDEKKIALELELTSKNRFRLETILKGYSANFDTHEVWYFCARNVLTSVATASSHLNYVKVFDFEKFLNGEITIES